MPSNEYMNIIKEFNVKSPDIMIEDFIKKIIKEIIIYRNECCDNLYNR